MKAHALSCDWGSSRVRLRLVEVGTAAIRAEVISDRGASRIVPETPGPEARCRAFADVLGTLIAQLQSHTSLSLAGLPVVASGMVTSSHGWCEVPYGRLPMDLTGRSLGLTRTSLDAATGTHTVLLVAGLCSGADVMRGEECELFGLAQTPGWDGQNAVVLLPGTHSKHATVRDNAIRDFTTFMTGELLDVLLHDTVLARTASLADPADAAALPAFREGVAAAVRPGLTPSLFQVRARALLGRAASTAEGGAYLQGLLVGDELARLASAAEPAPRIWLCAGTRHAPAYIAAAGELGLSDVLHQLPPKEVDSLAVRGHCALLRAQAVD